MKKAKYYIYILILILSCKNEFKKEYNLLNEHTLNYEKKSEPSDTLITNIFKSCEDQLENSIDNYFLCKNWKILNEQQIKDIIKHSKKGDGGYGDYRRLDNEITQSSIWINADLKIKNKKYKLKINSGSYFYIIDSKSNSFLYFCDNKKLRNYFLSGIGVEDDNLYRNILSDNLNKIKSNKTDLSKWVGDYEFDNGNYEQSYLKYNIKISKNSCVIFQGELPAFQLNCITLEKNNVLYMYSNADNLKSIYDTSYLKNKQKGDFILKIFRIKNKLYLNTKLVKFWDEDSHNFVDNHNFELTKI